MKVSYLGIIFILLNSCSTYFNSPIEGSKNIETKVYTPTNFEILEVSSAIKVVVIKSDDDKIEINAPTDLINHLIVNSSKPILTISMDQKQNFSTTNIYIKVYCKSLNTLKVNSSGSVLLNNFIYEKFNFFISGSGNVIGDINSKDINMCIYGSGLYKGKIHAENANLELKSSGSAQINGHIKKAFITVESSGKLNGEKLNIDFGKIQVSSSGILKTNICKNAFIYSKSSGYVEIKNIGNAILSNKTESSGQIIIN